MESSAWMPLSVDFKLVENCEGISENCEKLTYMLSLVATKGQLMVEPGKISQDL